MGRNPRVTDRRIAVGLAPGEYNVRDVLGNTVVTKNHLGQSGLITSTVCEKTSGIAGTGASSNFDYGYSDLNDCDPISTMIVADDGSSTNLWFSGSAQYILGLGPVGCSIDFEVDLTLNYSNTGVDNEEKQGNNGNMYACAAGYVNFRRDYIIRIFDDSSTLTPPLNQFPVVP